MKYFYLIGILLSAAFLSCGSQKGISTSRSAEKVVTHRVSYGETWESISRDFYGDEERAGELAVFNGRQLQVLPEAGAGVRIPLTSKDLRVLGKRLDAAEAYNRGLDLVSEGNYAEAVEEFRCALEVDPQFSDAAFNLGVTYQKLGLHKNATTVLRDLVTRSPGNPNYMHALGHSLFHTGELNGARRAFLKVLAIDPGHLKSIFSLATVYERMGKVKEAQEWWMEYIERDPNSEWTDKARSHLESLLRSGGGNR